MLNLLKQKMASNKGFTIVELVVVIAVIGILAALTLMYMSNITLQARDSEKEAKVGKIALALEKYKASNGRYPATTGELNSANVSTQLPNYTAVKTMLPGLTDQDLSGPGNTNFFPLCSSSFTCRTQTNWPTYRRDQIIYMAQYVTPWLPTGTYTYEMRSGGGVGPGCTVRIVNANPGYVIAWYNEAESVWKFKVTGGATLTDNSPIAGQVCAAS